MKIQFNKPSLLGGEIANIRDAIRRGQISGDGYYTRQCSLYLERRLKVPRFLLTPSCTHALEMAFILMDLEPGNEVVLPSFTFPSTANAFVLRGARPRFVDIRRDTLNIDENLIESALSSKTRALLPVHYAGVPCQMDTIMQISRRRRLVVVEDAAQALGASWRGKWAGTFGSFSAFSFHETKNCVCGEGGGLVVNNPRAVTRAEIIRQKGTDRERFYRGEVDRYSWMDVGSSYVPSELQTAYLYAQLGHLTQIQAQRRRLHETYWTALSPYQARGTLRLPIIPKGAVSAYHLFHVVFNSQKDRDRIMLKLREKKILAISHYFPLHLSKMGRKFGYGKGDCPITEEVSDRLLRLPLYNSMTRLEQSFVINSLRKLL